MTGATSEANFPGRASGAKSHQGAASGSEATSYTRLLPEAEKVKRTPRNLMGRPSKKHICPDCQNAFSSPYHLKRHRRSHTGERPYKCNECDCAFKQVPHLKAHRHVHVKERPYKCQQCEFSFKRADTLKVHLRIHTGQKPFRCKICGFAYSRNANLKSHKCFRTRKVT